LARNPEPEKLQLLIDDALKPYRSSRYGYDSKKSTPLWFYVLREAAGRGQ
jgi:hypothetical protein